MTDKITGGEPVKKIVQLTDAQMDQVKSLIDAGVGQPGPMSDRAAKAVMSIRGDGLTRGQRYQARLEAHGRALTSNDPYVSEERAKANAAYLRTIRNESPSPGDVHTDAATGELSTQYGNDEFIGEELLPAVLVGKQTNLYPTYGKSDRLQLPADDRIAEMGETVEVVESRSTSTYACVDRGFKNGLAANTVANQDAPLDEMFDLTAGLLDRRGLARERRIATVVTTAGNYPAANKVTLAGADQWNAAGGGDPIGAMQTADAALWRGIAPAVTRAFCSLDIYNVLSRHEDFLGLFQYSGTAVGLATPQMISGFLGWENLLVGRARYDSAVEGDTDVYARVWGDYFGVLRVAMRQTVRSATFGLTFRWTMPGVVGANQGIVTQQWFDANKGLGGAHFAKVGESEDHAIQADDAGYLISDCLA